MVKLKDKRIVVTGGAGFLGRHLVARLKERGCKKIFVLRSKDYDLVQMPAIRKLYKEAQPDIVIHLAAKVGGIGANEANPGKFFYDNLMMGAQMMEVGRQRGIEKFVAIGTICCYPKFTPVSFKEENLWDGYPEETNAPYGLAKKMLLVQSQAYRKQYGFNSIFLLPVNLYGPCFSQDTDLMTKHGIKNIKEINTGDIVYTLNPKSFDIEESRVTATQQIPTNEMFIFKNKSVDFRVTPDHKIFYRTSTGFVKRRADYFRKRLDRKYGQITFAFHNPKNGGVYPEQIILSRYTDKKHIYLPNGYVKDFGSSAGSSSKPYPLKYKVEDFARFLGWYISEGSVSQIGKRSYQIRITQRNKSYRPEIEQLLKSMDIPFGKDRYAFYFTSRVWRKFIEEHIGKGAGNKRIPEFVFLWHPRLLDILFKSLMKGDGSKNGRKYTTKSKQLMMDFLQLAFLSGINVGSVSNDGCWRISLRNHKKNITVKYKDINVETVNEKAYCITTDRNHIIYAGRNLKFNWIGQCDNFDPKTSHVIPALIKKCVDATRKNEEKIIVWGTGRPTREFLYVEDAAEGIILATEKYNKSEPVNLGAGFEISIRDLAKLIAGLTGFKGHILWDKTKPDGQPHRCLDVSRAQRWFGFKAKTKFEEGLKNTIDWYRNIKNKTRNTKKTERVNYAE